jgi:hypothetical protein
LAMVPLPAFLLPGERYVMLLVFLLGMLAVVRIFRKLGSRPAVIIGIAALCAIELLHRVRPIFHHPQNRTDDWVMFFALLLGQLLVWGFVWPLLKVMNGLCDSKIRRSYVQGAMRSDLAWFGLVLVAVYVSFRLHWWLS